MLLSPPGNAMFHAFRAQVTDLGVERYWPFHLVPELQRVQCTRCAATHALVLSPRCLANRSVA